MHQKLKFLVLNTTVTMQFGSKTFYTRNTYPGGVKM